MCKLFQGQVYYYTVVLLQQQRNDKITVFFILTFCHEKQRRKGLLRCEKVKQYNSSICTNISTTRVWKMYPALLQCIFVVFMRKAELRIGGLLRKQKQRWFLLPSAQIFSCNYSGKGKLNKGCKKPGQTAAFCFFLRLSPHIWPSRCIQEKNQEAEEWPTARKTWLCTKRQQQQKPCFSDDYLQ